MQNICIFSVSCGPVIRTITKNWVWWHWEEALNHGSCCLQHYCHGSQFRIPLVSGIQVFFFIRSLIILSEVSSSLKQMDQVIKTGTYKTIPEGPRAELQLTFTQLVSLITYDPAIQELFMWSWIEVSSPPNPTMVKCGKIVNKVVSY